MVESWFAQNLQLTYTFFSKNVSDDLWMKVSKTYEGFPAGQQGGPLFFILMMNHLLSDTEEGQDLPDQENDRGRHFQGRKPPTWRDQPVDFDP
jgi:hypothetical protein